MPKLMNYKSQNRSVKLTYWRSGTDYRVASLLTRYLTAKGIIPVSLRSIGQI